MKKKNLEAHEAVRKEREEQEKRRERDWERKKNKAMLEQIKYLEKELESLVGTRKPIPVFSIKEKKSGGMSEATAVVIASDWHIEEIVLSQKVNGMNEFNLSIAKQRAIQFFQNTLRLTKKEQQDVKIKTLILALLGDFISSNIHDELLENCSLRPVEAILVAQEWIASGIQFLLDNSSLELIIPCHVGNHSRITKKVHVSTETGNSLEYYMYHNLRNHFRENKRVTFLISESYLSYVQVHDNYTICFSHGHSIKYGGGIGGLFIPAFKAISQWQKLKNADLYVFGHFHQAKDGGVFLCNSSLIGFNPYAIHIKADYEKPKQLFFLIDRKRGRTGVFPILFDI